MHNDVVHRLQAELRDYFVAPQPESAPRRADVSVDFAALAPAIEAARGTTTRTAQALQAPSARTLLRIALLFLVPAILIALVGVPMAADLADTLAATADEVMAHDPEGVFLSNGPGDPAATGSYAVPMIQSLLERGLPIFGICLGHQMLALALGARTVKMSHGHHGANHPVRDVETGRVEITSMNHGFAVDSQTLPQGVIETHVSLFDGSNCGIRLDGRPVFSVQYHPEAAPGPQDSLYLFDRFTQSMRARRAT